MTTLSDEAALLLRTVAFRQRGATRWVAVADVIAVSGLPGQQVESTVGFLLASGLLTANGTKPAAVRLSPDGAQMLRS